MFKVYILFSERLRRYYIGHTEDLDKRLTRHDQGQVRSTRLGAPWKIVYTEDYVTRPAAHARELQIKAYKGGEAFKKIINLGSVPK